MWLRNSNTSPSGRTKLRWSFKWLLAAFAAVCLVNSAEALSPNRTMSQYLHDRWGAEQGFPGGPVYAIAQTPDGYLWIGTGKGLVRFDGLSFQLFQNSDSTGFPAGPVLGLAVDARGDLWVRPQGQKLLRYHNGIFQDVLQDLTLAEADVTAMCVGKNGEILFSLFSRFAGGTIRYSNGRLVPVAPPAELPRLVISLAETADGKVWMGTREQGLYYFSDGRVSAVSSGLPDRKINALLAINSRELWIGTDNGVAHWNAGQLTKAGMSPMLDRTQALVIARDRDANEWIGTSNGLIRIDARGISSMERGDIESRGVSALFEDREGNLWIGTTRGIERLRDNVFTTYSVSNGLPFETNGPVYVDPGGRAWSAPFEGGGLYWLKDGHVGRVKQAGLDRDVVYSIDGRDDELWIGRQRGGLTHLLYSRDSFTTKTYTQSDGLAQNSVYAVHQNRDGTVWAGTLNAGLSRFRNGSFTTYTTANGLASNTIVSIIEASDGTMWFGTPNGVNAFSNGQWRVYTSRDGLPPGNVSCLLEDSTGGLWVGTANGLALISSGRVHMPNEAPRSLREAILGIAEDRTGSLWIATANHVLRFERNKLLQKAVGDADVREYGLVDGLLSMQGVNRHKSAVADSVGRIWLSTNRGLSFVDPTPMTFSLAPALVHVAGISADGRPINIGDYVRIPAAQKRITFSYTGLSLSVPERIRFKYRLDGFDQGWSEPVSTREAVYTNLSAGPYRFRLIASNSDGLWNSSESSISFTIDPVFWQTWWFQLSILVVLAAGAIAVVRLRMLKLTRQLNVRFEERLAERTRIAQELHDTLLQGFLSASMQLHVADDHLPLDSPAKALVGRVLELMGHVIEEGRNAVRGLRTSKRSHTDLEQAFALIRQEFPVQSQLGFRVIVEGTPLPLRSVVCDEVYRIGHEALSNAFRHSHARDIEVELEYAASHLRVFIRDNGSGIDAEVLRSGRDDHWGLSGMKERSERIGGKLRVLSNAGAGTEIQLSVPGQIAFDLPSSESWWGWLSKLNPGRVREEQPKAESERPR